MMEGLLYLSLFFLGSSNAQISVVDTGGGFEVSYNGLTLLEHSASSPAFAVASSVAFEAAEDMGNYEITDEYSDPISLDAYEIGEEY